jgi:hypothetical protein
MKVLVACEFSGIVRDAFIRKGHDAVSIDLLPTERPGPHISGDVKNYLNCGWDLMIAHPPCTYLTTTGARWLYDPRYPNRKRDKEDALDFVRLLMSAPIGKIAIENPVGAISTNIRKPDCIIQPYQFGHDATKATCLWLKDLPNLVPTKNVEVSYLTTSSGKRFSKWYWETSRGRGTNRQMERSRTFQGIADAMADQWG